MKIIKSSSIDMENGKACGVCLLSGLLSFEFVFLKERYYNLSFSVRVYGAGISLTIHI